MDAMVRRYNAEDEFFQRNRLCSRAEIVADPCPVPGSPGVYAWFFREIPPQVPTAGCVQRQGLTLLYVGISPKKPTPGKEPSHETIKSRLCDHMGRTNAEGSTVRMTLGCLLSDTLGIRLQRLGNRFTFGAGEAVLSEWIGRNAFVSWTLDPEPWLLEDRLIASLDLPLNLQGNGRHPFYPILKKIRPRAKAAARANVTV
jgi:GIY-YIG catalytic domain